MSTSKVLFWQIDILVRIVPKNYLDRTKKLSVAYSANYLLFTFCSFKTFAHCENSLLYERMIAKNNVVTFKFAFEWYVHEEDVGYFLEHVSILTINWVF